VGAIAELLGAVATVATLAYLAVQIHQASATSRAQIRQSIADSQIHHVDSRAIDPLLRRANQKLCSGEELDDEERFGLQVHLITHLRLFENHFAQYSLGAMDSADRRAQRELLKRLLQIGAYREAYSFIDGAWNRHLAAEVERIRAES
jgi:hypothetical protein